MSTELFLNQLTSSSTNFLNFSDYFENANLLTPSTSPSTESTTQNAESSSKSVLPSEEQKIEEILLPALVGHQALPIHLKLLYDAIFPSYPNYTILDIMSQTDWTMEDFKRGYIRQKPNSDEILTIWKCANFPITSKILITAKEYYPNLSSTIDSLQKSLTQTILVSLTNNNSLNGIEMPTIASLAPNNTSLHLENVKNDENENIVEKLCEISHSPLSMDGLPPILSPAKSEFSSTTETESLKSSVMTEIGNDADAGSLDLEKSKSYKNKKRVQCDKCGHTFCDKGALKIHNSSVHLREMHTCTVPGCNKQFPSKRSRNRHSNNPNMHTETGRRRNCRSIAMTTNLQENQQISTPNPPILATLQKLLTANIQTQIQIQQNQALDLTSSTTSIIPPTPIIGLSSLMLPNMELNHQIQQPIFNVTELIRILIAQKQKSNETNFC